MTYFSFTFDNVNLCKLVPANQCNYIPKTHLLSIFPHFTTNYYQIPQFNTLRIGTTQKYQSVCIGFYFVFAIHGFPVFILDHNFQVEFTQQSLSDNEGKNGYLKIILLTTFI